MAATISEQFETIAMRIEAAPEGPYWSDLKAQLRQRRQALADHPEWCVARKMRTMERLISYFWRVQELIQKGFGDEDKEE